MVVEREAVQRIIAMAGYLDAPIQIFHVSDNGPAAKIARARARDVKVWAEPCTQCLTLTAADLDREGFEGAKFVFSPALRTAAGQAALWSHLRLGVLDNVTADQPRCHRQEARGRGRPSTVVPNGIPALAARLPILFSEGATKGRIDLATSSPSAPPTPPGSWALGPGKAPSPWAPMPISPSGTSTTRPPTNALMHHGVDYTPYEAMGRFPAQAQRC
jgi:dihydropyrimidinase